jgi:nucleoside-diphosphate-sugar epimerase
MNAYFLMLFVNLCNAFTPKKKLVVFGSTGKTGQCVVSQALEKGLDVVSLIRPNYDLVSSENHTIYKGDATNFDDVFQIYQQNDVLGTIISLGGNTKEVGKSMLTDSTRNILESIKQTHSSPRISLVTSIGVGDSVDKPPFFFKILMNTLLKDGFIDKNSQEELFDIYDGFRTTIVRPSGLFGDISQQSNSKTVVLSETKYNENGKLIFEESDYELYNGIGSISRTNVAQYLLNSVLVPPDYYKKVVSISSEF